jgi:hypothetical protein
MKRPEHKPEPRKQAAAKPAAEQRAASASRVAAGKTPEADRPPAKKKAAAAKGLQAKSRLRAFFTSPAITVNAVMEWLNAKLGLKLPTLPLAGWPAVLKSLWEMFVKGTFPSGPLPWEISIDGSWPAIFPQIGPTPVQLENLTITVKETSTGSPD